MTAQDLRDAIKYHGDKGNTDAVRALTEALRAMEVEGAVSTEDPGALKSLAIGAGRTVDRLGKGMKQLWLAARDDQEGLEKLREEASADDEIYRRLQKIRPWSTGFGEAAPLILMPSSAGATMASTAARMAAAGAAPGLLEYGSLRERLGRGAAGAAAGAAVPVAVKGATLAARSLGQTGRAMIDPMTTKGRDRIISRTLARVTDDTPGVVQRLEGATPLVPGSKPTAAQVAGSGGLSALERAAQAANPDAYSQRLQEQAAARIRALRTVAGDDAALEVAKAVRQRAAERSYKHAFMAGVDQEMADALKPQIKELLKNPFIREARPMAKRFADAEHLAINDMGSVQGLHFLKMGVDDIIGRAKPGSNEQRLAMEAKKNLMSVLEQIAPEYKDAVARYERLSRPINRMEIGRKVLEKVEPALNDWGGLASQKGETMARALRNADGLARQATGFRGAKYAKMLEPEHRATIDAVMRDLARAANRQNLGREGGSDTVQKLIFSDIQSASGVPRLARFAANMPLISRAAEFTYRPREQLIRERLAEVLLDPQQTAKFIKASKRRLSLNATTPLRRAIENTSSRAAALPALTLASEAVAEPAPTADQLQLQYLDE